MKYLLTPAAMLILAQSIPSYSEPSVSRGLMLKMHGFEEDAKRAFIDLLYNDVTHEEDKADALYQLGLIAFNNKDIGLATETWGLLIDEFPNTEKGRTVSAGIKYLLEDYNALVLESAKEEIRDREEVMRNALAQSYFLNAQFWWDPPKQWSIYTSHINQLTMAREWYDKVVTEFPRTDAAKKAMSYRFMLYKDGMEAYWKGRQLLFDVLMGKRDAADLAASDALGLGLVSAGGAAGAIGSKNKAGQALGGAVAVAGLVGAIVQLNKAAKTKEVEIPNGVLELSKDFEPIISPLIHEYNKFVEDFPSDAVAHIMELQIAQEYHIGVKLIATWFGELEGPNPRIASQIVQLANTIADESVRWCSLVPQAQGIVYQAAQATITDVRDFQVLLQDLFDNHLMPARISRLKKTPNIAHPKEVPSDVREYQFQFNGSWFRITHSDISVRVDEKTLSVPIEQFDNSENVAKFLRSMIRDASQVGD